MLKVLIVDDEAIFRFGLASYINWKDYGCTICGEAKNGKEALDLIYREHPDIVFLDIKMPLMDGISVLRELKDKAFGIYFVIMSCFNEYEYVREAMKLGAFDYLFKPVFGQEDLIKIVEEISQKKLETAMPAGQHKVQESQKIEHLLYSLVKIRNSHDASKQEDPMDICKEIGLIRSGLEITSFYVTAYMFYQNCLRQKIDDHIRNIISAVYSQQLPNREYYVCIHNEVLYLLLFKEETEKFTPELFDSINDKASGYMDLQIQSGISRKHYDITELPAALNEADLSFDYLFFSQKSVSFYAKTQHYLKSYDYDELFQELSGELQQSLFERNFSRSRELICQYRLEVISGHYYNKYDYCHFLINNLLSFMRTYKNGEYLQELLMDDYEFVFRIYKCQSIDAANNCFFQILETCFDKVKDSTQNTQLELVSQAVEYIQKNYNKKISLQDVSDHVHLNRNYFCKLFKNYTGTSFVSYLNEYRLKKATELIENTDLMIYEIATEVGFQGYAHFCKMYKKRYGKNPTEIRRGDGSFVNRSVPVVRE